MQEPQSPVSVDTANEILTEQILKQCVAFVEATYFESIFLQERHGGPLRWEELKFADDKYVGCIDSDPLKQVRILFFYAKLKGKLIAFYGPSSRFVDYEMIDQYIKSHYPVKYGPDQKWAMCTAMDFHHVFDMLN